MWLQSLEVDLLARINDQINGDKTPHGYYILRPIAGILSVNVNKTP